MKAVEKLSNLLRYSLYENKEKVVLKKELNYMNDFIELEQLRYDFEVKTHIDIEEGIEHIQIAPFLFIPYIENAYKHGDVGNNEKPISISFRKKGKHLNFSINNQKKKKQLDGVGGIGLKNVKKRLDLIYVDQYFLDIQDLENEFKVDLQIKNIC